MRLLNFLVNRQPDRDRLEHKRDAKNPVRPFQIRRRVRMSQFFDAFVNRIGRTNTKNEDGRYKRPEESFFPVPERVFL